MKKRLMCALIMSAVVSTIATVSMVLIPRLDNPGEFVNAPALPVHLLVSFAAVFAVCVPISLVFYWLRDAVRR